MLAIALVLGPALGCDDDDAKESLAEAPAANDDAPRLVGGTVVPGLRLLCYLAGNDAAGPTAEYEDAASYPLGPAPDGFVRRLETKDCGTGEELQPWNEDPGTTIMAVVRASPIVEPTLEGEHRFTLKLEAEASRRCLGNHLGTFAGVYTRWETTLALPPGLYRIQLTADASEDFAPTVGPERCSVSLDGELTEPIASGSSRLVTRHLEGGRDVPLVIDCTAGLVENGCYGIPDDVAPPTVRRQLDLQLGATRVE